MLHQNGWRDLQSTDLQNIYGDVGWRSERAELHLNITAAHSVLNGPGTSPVELLAVAPAAQFTAPNQISNQYAAVSLNGSVDVTDTTSVQALAYYRYFLQRVTNGNAPNDTPCTDGSGLLCFDRGFSTTLGGAFIPDFLNGGPYSELDNQTTNTNAYGASVQVTNTNDLFGLKNHFVAGVSFDGAQTMFSAASFIGGLTPLDRVFIGPGVVIDEPGTNSPVRVGDLQRHIRVYIADTLNLTPQLAVTRLRPLQRGAGRPERSERWRPDRQSQLQPLQSGRRHHLSGHAMADRLCRLCRGEPRAHAGRTVVCRSHQLMQPGEFLRRRSGSSAGRVAHRGGRRARQLSRRSTMPN